MEFALKAHFPDDRGQTFPAVGIPYIALTAQGGVEGRLDGSGEVIIPDTGIAAVTIETLPDVEKEIRELREAIRKEMDAIIAREREEADAIRREYNESGWLQKRGKDISALGNGIWNFTAGIFGALWSVATGVGEALSAVGSEIGEYLLDPLNAPETFKKDVAAVKAKYEALRKFADEDLETYFILAGDEKT